MGAYVQLRGGERDLRWMCAGVHDGLYASDVCVCSVCIQLRVHVDQHVCTHCYVWGADYVLCTVV